MIILYDVMDKQPILSCLNHSCVCQHRAFIKPLFLMFQKILGRSFALCYNYEDRKILIHPHSWSVFFVCRHDHWFLLPPQKCFKNRNKNRNDFFLSYNYLKVWNDIPNPKMEIVTWWELLIFLTFLFFLSINLIFLGNNS